MPYTVENPELVTLLAELGEEQVAKILNKHKPKAKRARVKANKFLRLPVEIRAKAGIMLVSGEYTKKDVLDWIHERIDELELDPELKISKTEFYRHLSNV